jgi:hypothetical protein
VSESPLSALEVELFTLRGFVRLREAFPREVAEECRAFLWNEVGLSSEDPAAWTKPVIRIRTPEAEPFREAAHTPRLFAAYDQLVGHGRWKAHHAMGGTTVIRFPVEGDPGDDGWHLDLSFERDGKWWINARSEGRALLMLFLFSEVGADDAPTRIRVGSHLDLPAWLAKAGDHGVNVVPAEAVPNIHERALALATGQPGDVYLCHPLLYHAADRNRGRRVRFLAQPGLMFEQPLDLEAPPDHPSPVERAIRIGLGAL